MSGQKGNNVRLPFSLLKSNGIDIRRFFGSEQRGCHCRSARYRAHRFPAFGVSIGDAYNVARRDIPFISICRAVHQIKNLINLVMSRPPLHR